MLLTASVTTIDDLRRGRLPPSIGGRATALPAGEWIFETHGDLIERPGAGFERTLNS